LKRLKRKSEKQNADFDLNSGSFYCFIELKNIVDCLPVSAIFTRLNRLETN
jgi:hypothetical protein